VPAAGLTLRESLSKFSWFAFTSLIFICVPQRFSQVQKANIGSGGGGDQPALQSCVKVRGKGRLSTVCSADQFMDVLDSIRECDQEVSRSITTCTHVQ
jgi:hypothetical protein